MLMTRADVGHTTLAKTIYCICGKIYKRNPTTLSRKLLVGSWLIHLAQRELKATNVLIEQQEWVIYKLMSLPTKKRAVQVTQEESVAVPAVSTTYQ